MDLAITFLYYRDLPRACAFQERVPGVTLAIDQGWRKICRIAAHANVGLVDKTRGMLRASDPMPVQVCPRGSGPGRTTAALSLDGQAYRKRTGNGRKSRLDIDRCFRERL